MAGQKPNLHAVDQILDFSVEENRQPPEADRTPRRGPKRAASTGVRKPLVIPELRDAYRTITENKAVGERLARTVYFEPAEFERIQNAAYHLGGIPAGVLSHYAAMYLIEQLEEKNGGPFAPIPHRG